jgi:hypothetical protein
MSNPQRVKKRRVPRSEREREREKNEEEENDEEQC